MGDRPLPHLKGPRFPTGTGLRSRQKINLYFLSAQAAKKMGKASPFLGGKAREPQGRTGFALFLQGLKVGFAHFQTQINPAKSRVLLFDEHLR
jgi:hypothetical protein